MDIYTGSCKFILTSVRNRSGSLEKLNEVPISK